MLSTLGFASQQVLGQALAGLFLLLSRPFRIKDHISVTGEEGTSARSYHETLIQSRGDLAPP